MHLYAKQNIRRVPLYIKMYFFLFPQLFIDVLRVSALKITQSCDGNISYGRV